MLTDAERQEFTRYAQVITYSLDEARRNVKARDTKLYDRLATAFCKDLYHERTWAENEIARFVRESRRVLSVEGVEGCGKSTITRRALRNLGKGYPSLLFDFNLLANDPLFKHARDYPTFNAALADIIRRDMLSRYFAPEKDRMEAVYDLALFSDEPVTAREFVDQRMELGFLSARNLADVDETAKMKWYRQHLTTDAIRALRKTIYEKVTYAHLIMVLRDTLPVQERFVVVLDNVDRLQRQLQPYCYNFALSFNNEMYEFAKLVINIRPENAHLPPEITGQRSEHVDVIRLVDLSDREYLNTYLDSEGFHHILECRQRAYSNICGTSPLSEKLAFLTTSLKDEYAELILIDLANQSIRSALEYHCKFLLHLLDIFPFEELKQLITRGLHRSLLVSSLLGWIAECGEVLSDQNLNPAKLVRDAERSNYHVRGCDLSYLILVCLSKQTVNQQGEEIYRISLRSLAAQLSVLGFTEEEVQQEVYHLYFNKNREFGHIISISNDEIVHSKVSISEKTRISINFRGKRLLESASSRFFFVNRLRNKTRGKDIREYSGPFGYYDYSHYGEHARDNLILLAHIARLHCIELIRIAARMERKDWLATYKRDFALDGKLQFSRMIASNIRFLQGSEAFLDESEFETVRAPLAIMIVLSNLYENCVDSICSETTRIYDYVRIIHVCLEGGEPRTAEFFMKEEFEMDVKKILDAGE